MSEAMKALQAKVGATPDGAFGPNTARAIAKHYDLSPLRAAHLLGQASHESAGFKLTRENLNYSAEAMCRVWPHRFKTDADCDGLARNPKALAEYVYFDDNRGPRHKLGNDTKEKASLYIGRGFIQLTGYNNVKSFASDMGCPEVLTDPLLLETEFAFETALWFFQKNNLFEIADRGTDKETITKMTRRINGGKVGLDHRIKETKKIHGWLDV